MARYVGAWAARPMLTTRTVWRGLSETGCGAAGALAAAPAAGAAGVGAPGAGAAVGAVGLLRGAAQPATRKATHSSAAVSCDRIVSSVGGRARRGCGRRPQHNSSGARGVGASYGRAERGAGVFCKLGGGARLGHNGR